MFFNSDLQNDVRQAGIVDAEGRAATYTGSECKPWAGGCAESHPCGSYAIQGNLLTGPEVIGAMVDAWCASDINTPLPWRLLTTLEAGENAGGDKRGRQASALYVIEKGKGYKGTSDVLVDLKCDHSDAPISDLRQLLELHDALPN